ncbi:DUF3565 domain-containing protein [Pseudomonas sp.]|uniref:DUF3565 domain-containing protein n=1 Tax=Pseudomonas sp. TaxID=306 RepID=UPI002355EB1D|nr:DUF3565 domain-containing protein [Pseudomonas sp.]
MHKNLEGASLPVPQPESDPNTDRRAWPRLLGFKQDEHGHWIALLSCGHTQHLRHQPPWQSRAWVLDAERRGQQLGQPFDCGWCRQQIRLTDKES